MTTPDDQRGLGIVALADSCSGVFVTLLLDDERPAPCAKKRSAFKNRMPERRQDRGSSGPQKTPVGSENGASARTANENNIERTARHGHNCSGRVAIIVLQEPAQEVARTRGWAQYTYEAVVSAVDYAEHLTKSETWYGRPGHEEDGILTGVMRSAIGDDRLVSMTDDQTLLTATVYATSIVAGFYVAPAGIAGSIAAGAATELGVQLVLGGDIDLAWLNGSASDGALGGAVGFGIGKLANVAPRGLSTVASKASGGAKRLAGSMFDEAGQVAGRIGSRIRGADELATHDMQASLASITSTLANTSSTTTAFSRNFGRRVSGDLFGDKKVSVPPSTGFFFFSGFVMLSFFSILEGRDG